MTSILGTAQPKRKLEPLWVALTRRTNVFVFSCLFFFLSPYSVNLDDQTQFKANRNAVCKTFSQDTSMVETRTVKYYIYSCSAILPTLENPTKCITTWLVRLIPGLVRDIRVLTHNFCAHTHHLSVLLVNVCQTSAFVVKNC